MFDSFAPAPSIHTKRVNHTNGPCPVTIRSRGCQWPLRVGSCAKPSWRHAQGCELRRLPDAVAASTHLFAMLAVVQSAIDPLLPHWLQHYASLGVNLTIARIVLHAPRCDGSRGLNQTLAALRLHGVTRPRIFIDTWSSSIKTDLANDYFRKVPANAYIMRVDSDEFFSFPCELLGELARDPRGLAVLGMMFDRVAEDWSMPAVTPIGTRPLSAQYPRRCRFTFCAWKENEDKWMLLPARDADGKRVRFHSSAALFKGLKLRYLRWAFAHYRFTEAAVALTMRKIKEYSQQKHEQSRVGHYTYLSEEFFARKHSGDGHEISGRMRYTYGNQCMPLNMFRI